ncbi:type II toxin-antitoxin system PemK/MazF family toxin [Chamaesiphon sp. GL140_3_metabinner_50]|uniref:type II toxin-antitoxin system PemK/MazF family toxin n=1 Tax=Chamaesiphon sp. GL140_3_metabinner_50 TaxID=2970812 RepID=UPI0025DBB5A5|nr:type II toxin-antitoxin system PemK/MazF family toxin [Chamaesiphon sp. GL140_3_metabinner_50]
MVDYIPACGDLIWLNFDPQSGREQMGKRPALVVSHTEFNQHRGFILVCPVSNTQRKNPFYVSIPEGEAVTGVVMADQLRSLDYKSRGAELIAICPKDLLLEVLGRIYPIMF